MDEERVAQMVRDWLKSGLAAKDCYDRLISDGLTSNDAWCMLDEGINLILMNYYEYWH